MLVALVQCVDHFLLPDNRARVLDPYNLQFLHAWELGGAGHHPEEKIPLCSAVNHLILPDRITQYASITGENPMIEPIQRTEQTDRAPRFFEMEQELIISILLLNFKQESY